MKTFAEKEKEEGRRPLGGNHISLGGQPSSIISKGREGMQGLEREEKRS